MDIKGQVEKIARDVTSTPDLSDMIEVGLVGAALGAALGYVRDREAEAAKEGAWTGAVVGVAGQLLLFHMLRPVVRRAAGSMYGQRARVGALGPGRACPPGTTYNASLKVCVPVTPFESDAGDSYVGDAMFPATGCPAGTTWSDWYGRCVSNIPPPPPVQLTPLAPTYTPPPEGVIAPLQPRTGIQSGPAIVGLGRGLAGFRGSQMPYGPGPWPTGNYDAPDEVGWGG
jgi:class 3 adenylate cyclase